MARVAPQACLLRSLGWQGEAFVVPRATARVLEAALPGGSYASGHVPIEESAMMSDAPSGEGLTQAAEHATPVRPERPASSPGAPDPAQGDSPPAHHVSQGSDLHGQPEVTDCVDPAQGDVCATRSAKLDQDGLIHVQSDESEPEEDSSSEASETSAASAETVDSSNCDPHEPEAAPGVAAPDLAAILASPDITQVVSGDVNAPLVTIAIDEAALAPAVLLLRVPFFSATA